MNFNVYIDRGTGERLDHLAKVRRISRNALIREAVAGLLERQERAGWPPEVLDFQGIASARPFEESRKRLREPVADPIA